jgi:hypothetical protein
VRHLFSRPMFQRDHNGCFVQISGVPVPELLSSAKKRPITSLSEGTAGWGSEILPRFKIFYKMCSRHYCKSRIDGIKEMLVRWHWVDGG